MELVQCDNCEKTEYRYSPLVEKWFGLYRLEMDDCGPEPDGVDPLTERLVHFCNINCLESWVATNRSLIT